MTQTGYSNAIVNVLLGWLKGLANWVLKLFNLAGNGGSPLLWLSQNWLKLLILLMVVGIVMDWLVWMIRWRPYWVWFRKKRIIVKDERFLSEEELSEDDSDDPLEQRYVVPSTVVKRRETPQPAQRTRVRRAASQNAAYRRPSTMVPKKAMRRSAKKVESADDLFEVGHDHEEYSDFFEDEVFNVSNLPEAQEPRRVRKRRR